MRVVLLNSNGACRLINAYLKKTPLCEQQWELNRRVCILGMSWNFTGKWLAACIEYRIATIHRQSHSLQWYGHHYNLVRNCLN